MLAEPSSPMDVIGVLRKRQLRPFITVMTALSSTDTMM